MNIGFLRVFIAQSENNIVRALAITEIENSREGAHLLRQHPHRNGELSRVKVVARWHLSPATVQGEGRIRVAESIIRQIRCASLCHVR